MEKVMIKEENIDRDYVNYLKPRYIYIPFCENIKINTYVYKGDLIGNEYSPISGFIRGSKIFNDNKEKYFIIENDYKERKRRSSVKCKIDELFNIIDSNIKYLVINAIDTEPYVYVRRALVKMMHYKVLEMIDGILKRYDIRKAIIVISDEYSYNLFNTYLGTYPRIRIIKINNYYPVSDIDLLSNELSLGKKSYVMEIERLIDIYGRISKGVCSDTVLITIGGNALKKSINVRVKSGTLLCDVMTHLGIKNTNYSLQRGGPLRGKRIKNANVVITKDDYAFMIFKEIYCKEEKCTLCGRCSDVCPRKLVPVFIMNNINNKKNLKKIQLYKCINCGLCSYICPSKIDLRSYIDRAKEVINNE